MKKLTGIILLGLIIVSFPRSGFCYDVEEGEAVTAIQKRLFHRFHELFFTTGYLTDDDFYYPYLAGLGYTYNFNDIFSWEVARGYMFINQEKDIKNDLETNFGATPTEFTEPKYLILSHLVVRPLYGKSVAGKTGVINHETYFFFGGGINKYERHFAYAEPIIEDAYCISIGAGIKYFLNQNVNFAFEVRDLVTFMDEKTVNNVWLGLNIGFRFNLLPRKAPGEEEVNNLTPYLKGN